MLHILLTILKIIWILILAILGIILLLLTTVLIVPIRYEVKAGATGTLESLEADAKISWLMKILGVYVSYREKVLDIQVKIFGKKLNLTKKEAKRVAEEVTREVTDSVKEDVKESVEDIVSDIKEDVEKIVAEEKEVAESIEENNVQATLEENDSEKEERRKKKNIKYTIQSICDKIKLVKEKKDEVVQMVKDEVHQAAVKRIFREVIRLFCFLKPKKIFVNAHFGFSDPSTTGQVLAVISVLYPFVEKNIDIEPDFENQVIEGKVYLKGIFRGIYVMIVAVNIILDKNVRLTIKELLKWKR